MSSPPVIPPTLPYLSEPECTTKCHSRVHASLVMNAITHGSEEEVMSYLQWLCSNHSHLIDAHGRTALHMAASCGKWRMLRWLLHKRAPDCNLRDWESGWTPLHRSLFYGQLTAAKVLLDHGANLLTLDHEHLSPMDLAMKDRPKYMVYRSAGLYEAYVWGINQNYNLGLGIYDGRQLPELVDTFRKENISITQIVLCKFHTMFLSSSGQVFACGQGYGGRLGFPVEQTVLKPKLLKSMKSEICIQIACSTDHSLLLMESGSVWTCGANVNHTLGHVPPMEKLLTPKPITGKTFKGHTILGVCAARFHSVVYTREAIFTFGLNAGQIGHPALGDKLQTVPRIVSALSNPNNRFTHVTASDGATICITEKGDIFVLHEYQCRTIASKRYDIVRVVASGGRLDAKAHSSILKEGVGAELRVVLLTNIGQLYVWSEGYPQVIRCLMSIGRHLHVADTALFNEGLLFITNDGEGFIGNFVPPKLKTESIVHQPVSHSSKQMVTSFANFLERDECVHLKIKRLSNVHRAVSVACDTKGRNFAVLQAHPKSSLLEVPQLSASQMVLNMQTLLQEADIYDNIHDVIIKIGKHQFAGHKYILALHCEMFCSQILKSKNLAIHAEDDCLMFPDLNVHPYLMQQILEFLYTGTCKLLTSGQPFQLPDTKAISSIGNFDNLCHINQPDLIASTLHNNHSTSAALGRKQAALTDEKRGKKDASVGNRLSNSNPVKMLIDVSKKLGIRALEKRLNSIQFVDGRVSETPSSRFVGKLKFDRMKLPELYDVHINSEDGVELKCHKCILVARSEYFHSMFTSNWIETKTLSSLTLPISGEILEIVITCLYTDDAPKLLISEDIEFVCNTLAIADRLLVSRLKEFCEIRLADLMTLKNAAELLEFSWVYNAPQLKATCMQFIGLNLPAFLEAKSLAILSDEVLVELTKNYRELIHQMCYRAVTPHLGTPSLEEIQTIAKLFPVKVEEFEDEDENPGVKGIHPKEGKKSKNKRKLPSRKPGGIYEESKMERSRDESICSVVSDILSPVESHAFNCNAKELTTGSPARPCVKKETVLHDIPLLPTSPSSKHSPEFQCLISQPSKSKWLEGVEDMNAAFPDLLNELKYQPSVAEKLNAKSECFRRTTKLSQKQRKKLASKPVSAPVTIPHASFPEKHIKTGNPWVAATPNYSPTSLKEIMAIEKGLVASKNVPESHSSQSLPSVNSPPTKLHGSDSPNNCENIWRSRQRTSSASNAENKFLPNDMTYDIKPSSSKDSTPCFLDILLNEQEEFYSLSKMSTKPLHLIQLEDQAIEELLQHYNAHKNPDECITVQRVMPQHVATPIWKTSKSLGN